MKSVVIVKSCTRLKTCYIDYPKVPNIMLMQYQNQWDLKWNELSHFIIKALVMNPIINPLS